MQKSGQSGLPLLKIIDFGVSDIAENIQETTIIKTHIEDAGTEGYNPHDKKITSRWDVYSIGCILNFILTGHTPDMDSYKKSTAIHNIIEHATEDMTTEDTTTEDTTTEDATTEDTTTESTTGITTENTSTETATGTTTESTTEHTTWSTTGTTITMTTTRSTPPVRHPDTGDRLPVKETAVVVILALMGSAGILIYKKIRK